VPRHASEALEHSAFYRFTHLAAPETLALRLRELAAQQALTGLILLAPEGINGTLAATGRQLDAFEHALQNDAAFLGAFAGMRFQRTACVTAPFRRLKVHVRSAIVDIGRELSPDNDAVEGVVGSVAPAQWDALIARDDVVLLDNRNQFEYQLGRFTGAIDPQVSHFRDFAAFVESQLERWQREGKTIAMYCTGGIRCEKTSAWLRDKNVPSFQLDGGILNYLRFKTAVAPLDQAAIDSPAELAHLSHADEQFESVFPASPQEAQVLPRQNTFPACSFAKANKSGTTISAWQGSCFVFDNRMALDASLAELPVSPEQVYTQPADAWRLARAQRLAARDA
jgi:UPF0176 protein